LKRRKKKETAYAGRKRTEEVATPPPRSKKERKEEKRLGGESTGALAIPRLQRKRECERSPTDPRRPVRADNGGRGERRDAGRRALSKSPAVPSSPSSFSLE